MSPNRSSVSSGSRGTRTHKRVVPAACFQDRFLIRPDDFREFQIAGAGIEPGTEPLAWSFRVQGPASLPATTIPQSTCVEGHDIVTQVRELRGQESNLRLRGQSPASLPTATTPQEEVDSGWCVVDSQRIQSRYWFVWLSTIHHPLSTFFRVPCGNRTRLSSLEGWHLCRSAKGT